MFWNLFSSFHKPVRERFSWFIFPWKQLDAITKFGKWPSSTCVSIPMMTVHFALPVLLKVADLLCCEQILISTHRTGSFSQTSQFLGHPASDKKETAWLNVHSNIYLWHLAYLPLKDLNLLKKGQALSKAAKQACQLAECNGVSKTSERIIANLFDKQTHTGIFLLKVSWLEALSISCIMLWSPDFLLLQGIQLRYADCAFLMTCSAFCQYQQAGMSGISCLICNRTVSIVDFCLYCWINLDYIFWKVASTKALRI